jgi:hypothetical protein
MRGAASPVACVASTPNIGCRGCGPSMVSRRSTERPAPLTLVSLGANRSWMNRWNIPAWLEREVVERDRSCVYCGTSFAQASTARRARPSWEHTVNDARIRTRENIALCCIGCNASKGAKALTAWLQSRYCIDRGITERSVAPIVQAALAAMASQSARSG